MQSFSGIFEPFSTWFGGWSRNLRLDISTRSRIGNDQQQFIDVFNSLSQMTSDESGTSTSNSTSTTGAQGALSKPIITQITSTYVPPYTKCYTDINTSLGNIATAVDKFCSNVEGLCSDLDSKSSHFSNFGRDEMVSTFEQYTGGWTANGIIFPEVNDPHLVSHVNNNCSLIMDDFTSHLVLDFSALNPRTTRYSLFSAYAKGIDLLNDYWAAYGLFASNPIAQAYKAFSEGGQAYYGSDLATGYNSDNHPGADVDFYRAVGVCTYILSQKDRNLLYQWTNKFIDEFNTLRTSLRGEIPQFFKTTQGILSLAQQNVSYTSTNSIFGGIPLKDVHITDNPGLGGIGGIGGIGGGILPPVPPLPTLPPIPTTDPTAPIQKPLDALSLTDTQLSNAIMQIYPNPSLWPLLNNMIGTTGGKDSLKYLLYMGALCGPSFIRFGDISAPSTTTGAAIGQTTTALASAGATTGGATSTVTGAAAAPDVNGTPATPGVTDGTPATPTIAATPPNVNNLTAEEQQNGGYIVLDQKLLDQPGGTEELTNQLVSKTTVSYLEVNGARHGVDSQHMQYLSEWKSGEFQSQQAASGTASAASTLAATGQSGTGSNGLTGNASPSLSGAQSDPSGATNHASTNLSQSAGAGGSGVTTYGSYQQSFDYWKQSANGSSITPGSVPNTDTTHLVGSGYAWDMSGGSTAAGATPQRVDLTALSQLFNGSDGTTRIDLSVVNKDIVDPNNLVYF